MSKLPNISTSIFTVMSKLATEYNAINLSQGFPNFPVDEKLTTIVAKLAKEKCAPIHTNVGLCAISVKNSDTN